MYKARKEENGFSLVDIIVGMGIFGVISIFFVSTLSYVDKKLTVQAAIDTVSGIENWQTKNPMEDLHLEGSGIMFVELKEKTGIEASVPNDYRIVKQNDSRSENDYFLCFLAPEPKTKVHVYSTYTDNVNNDDDLTICRSLR